MVLCVKIVFVSIYEIRGNVSDAGFMNETFNVNGKNVEYRDLDVFCNSVKYDKKDLKLELMYPICCECGKSSFRVHSVNSVFVCKYCYPKVSKHCDCHMLRTDEQKRFYIVDKLEHGCGVVFGKKLDICVTCDAYESCLHVDNMKVKVVRVINAKLY